MKIRSPPNLHYPITVVELHRQRDAEVKRSTPLFSYYYETVVTEIDKYGDEKSVKKRFPARFNSFTDGVISKWFIASGTVIKGKNVDLLEIEEPCTHEVQFGGLCADCGMDMTTVDYLTEQRNSERAKINMTHNNISLLVSEKEAGRADEEAKTRLLKAKKLSLIVDLDQTVIHTTCERTVAEWQADPNNPNYEAVKDVKGFQLADDSVSHVAANWYYVKMRPGLKEFLDRVSEMYEMHVYTMATRAYAQAVAHIIDPDGRYFGDRILSRDENYTDKLKSLNRLFPTNTDMVVIIDDRADIWHYCDNLIRVPVFNFFPGAGDINASFLPKQQELITATAKPTPINPTTVVEKHQAQPEPEGDSTKPYSVATNPVEPETNGAPLTELEQQLISMGSQGNPEVLEEQVKEQERVIITQQTERPLLQAQLSLDKEDEAETADVNQSSEVTTNGNAQTNVHHKHRHSLLHNDDRGLEIIERHLKAVYDTFYDEYQAKKEVAPGSRVAELRGSPRKRSREFVPDVKVLMPRIKEEVLDGVTIVFSGIIPLGMDVQLSDFALWVKSFGAQVSLNINKRTTHVIANPDRKTTKVKKAARYPHIKIVNAEWMLQCCARWEHVDETPYLIEIDAADRDGSPSDGLSDTDDEDDVPDVGTKLSDGEWDNIDKELADFLNDDDETTDDGEYNSDTDSVRSDASVQTDTKPNKMKRKRNTDSANNSDAEDSDTSVSSSSRLQRRKKRTMERVSSLTNVVTADKSSGLPSPETPGPEEEMGDEGNTVQPAGLDRGDDDSDDGLEEDMLKEFERSDVDDDA